MQARIENPALSVPGALQALQKLGTVAKRAGLPKTTVKLVELRASHVDAADHGPATRGQQVGVAGSSRYR